MDRSLINQLNGLLREDATKLVGLLKKKFNKDFEYVTCRIEPDEFDDDKFTGKITLKTTDNKNVNAFVHYSTDDDSVYSESISEVAEIFYDDNYEIFESTKIKASSSIHNQKITAAEGDEEEDDTLDGFDDSEFAFDDEEPIDDTLDEMSDTLDDMQDQLDEIVEDDPSIQVDNNISNHYIVECDKCKGVFISSIEESDAAIEKVSGRCPLCGKDSDQYLKWIIRDVDSEDIE